VVRGFIMPMVRFDPEGVMGEARDKDIALRFIAGLKGGVPNLDEQDIEWLIEFSLAVQYFPSVMRAMLFGSVPRENLLAVAPRCEVAIQLLGHYAAAKSLELMCRRKGEDEVQFAERYAKYCHDTWDVLPDFARWRRT
jgi:hypothetical protein